MKRSAARYLLQDDEGGTASQALETGWQSLSAKERIQAGNLSERKSNINALTRAAMAAGWSPTNEDVEDDPIFTALFKYYLGRSIRELSERRF